MRKLFLLSKLFKGVAIVSVATFLAVAVMATATTIGTNITTGGTLNVTGLTTLTTATTTSATSTNYIYIGPDGTEDLFDFSGGDLYVADDAEITGDLRVENNFTVANKATSTVALAVGAGTINNLNMAGGDLYVQDDVEIDDNLWVTGNATTTGDLMVSGGTIDLSTSSATTTKGIFSRDASTATSTVSIGGAAGTSPSSIGCLEMAATDGVYYNCYIDPHSVGTTTGVFLVCRVGRCN